MKPSEVVMANIAGPRGLEKRCERLVTALEKIASWEYVNHRKIAKNALAREKNDTEYRAP